ncbi:hypothetical protein BGZ99_000033 [Dissophora globulifera]|uniref:Ubiquitin-conjugating enzyme E2C-binding protein n=1 Tax=Dissophora globulifera TaxID=979702 RepID=A0A9P6V161_9FUNG|nr:hypothetical protein BGZ99_000033 [Dissophora globulifera]
MTSSSTDIKYYAEYHSKINSISLLVQVPAQGVTCIIGPQAVDLVPSVSFSKDQLDGSTKTSSGTGQRFALPARVMPTRTTLDPSSSQSSLLTVKLTALPSAPSTGVSFSSFTSSSGSEFPQAPLPAAQLQGLENLSCGCCGNILLKPDSASSSDQGQPIQRVVDLPSEHWQELVDCWMCHEEDFTELREGDLGARLGQALVGGTYVLIHAANVDSSTVAIEEDARSIDWTRGIKRRWRPLACSRCLYPVGEGWYQSRLEDGTDLELIQVKFHKYSIQFKGQQKDSNTLLSIPRQRFASYVAAEIFESARHHATYRFILQDRLEGHDMILLWMLNWDSSIVTNQQPAQDDEIAWDNSLRTDLSNALSSTNNTQGATGRKVMKVLYLKAQSDEQELAEKQSGSYSKETTLWDQWRGDPGVERMQFHKHLLLGLLTMLEQSSSRLPPTLNDAASTVLAMDALQVGSIEI